MIGSFSAHFPVHNPEGLMFTIFILQNADPETFGDLGIANTKKIKSNISPFAAFISFLDKVRYMIKKSRLNLNIWIAYLT